MSNEQVKRAAHSAGRRGAAIGVIAGAVIVTGAFLLIYGGGEPESVVRDDRIAQVNETTSSTVAVASTVAESPATTLEILVVDEAVAEAPTAPDQSPIPTPVQSSIPTQLTEESPITEPSDPPSPPPTVGQCVYDPEICLPAVTAPPPP